MTAAEKAMDSQRWICRTHLCQFNATSFEDEPKRIGRLLGRSLLRNATDFSLSAPSPAPVSQGTAATRNLAP
jgi:hypothetical protein